MPNALRRRALKTSSHAHDISGLGTLPSSFIRSRQLLAVASDTLNLPLKLESPVLLVLLLELAITSQPRDNNKIRFRSGIIPILQHLPSLTKSKRDPDHSSKELPARWESLGAGSLTACGGKGKRAKVLHVSILLLTAPGTNGEKLEMPLAHVVK